MFCRIKCFLDLHTLDTNETVRIWLKVINPMALSELPIEEIRDLLERFARGNSLDRPTLVSETFADKMI